MTINLWILSDNQLLPSAPTFLSSFRKSVPISISNDIWDTSKLLLPSGGIETSSGPRPIDKNPVFCSICSSKIKRGIQQDMAPTCSDTNCNGRCHQAWNSPHKILWSYYRGNVLNMALVSLKLSHLLLFMSLPSRPSAASKLCSICNNPIHSSYANLAYHCEDFSRDNVCHLSATCSGF